MGATLARLRASVSKLTRSAYVRRLEQENQALRDQMATQRVASEDMMQACFEAASQAILGVTVDGRIRMMNIRAEEMFGYARGEILGQSLEVLLPERMRDVHAVHRATYFAHPSAKAMASRSDLMARRKDGTEFPVEIGLAHVLTPEGPLAFGMVSDISRRKQAADRLQRANDELRRSNAEMEQFAHVASHDLQEPLRMISTYLQLIERRYSHLLDEDGREFIHYAVDGAVRMKALIEDLLNLSRAGTVTAKLQAVPALELVQHALTNLKRAVEESGARITVDPLPTVVVDPVLFTQVFQNLIANGIKFQQGGKPVISISAVRQGSEWIFAVRDNGIGIEARHLERIFGIFERLHSSQEYAGSGIGLAITRKIVERHGGRLWAESQPGTGSTFCIALSAEVEIANAAGSGGRS